MFDSINDPAIYLKMSCWSSAGFDLGKFVAAAHAIETAMNVRPKFLLTDREYRGILEALGFESTPDEDIHPAQIYGYNVEII